MYQSGSGRGPKSSEDRELILKALAENRFLRSLDREQRENFISAAVVLEYLPGEWILQQGERGDNFYALKEGTAEIIYKVICF